MIQENVIENNHLTSDVSSKVDFLVELLQCNGTMYHWSYSIQGSLIESNCSNMIYDTIFRYTGLLDNILSCLGKNDKPIIQSSKDGILWSCVFEKNNDETIMLHIFGPVFSTNLSEETVNRICTQPNVRAAWRPKLAKYLYEIPIVTSVNFINYTLMLHYSLNNEYLKPSDIVFDRSDRIVESDTPKPAVNYAEIWTRENSICDFIKSGDIYYKTKVPNASVTLQQMYPSSDSDLPNIKQKASIYVGQIIRAAIEGGISPDTAYLRGDIYLRNIISATSFSDIYQTCSSAFDDYLFLVHNHNNQPKYSMEVQACVDYIHEHTTDDLSIDALAEHIGYSDYYLSRKFKKEVGDSINTYIKKARIEHACYLLVSENIDIQEISDSLHFGNRNFFTKVFKEETGCTPAAFRDSHKRK